MSIPDEQYSALIRSGLIMLAVLQTVMLFSLFFGVEPHPTRTIALFAMSPFLAVSIGLALLGLTVPAAMPRVGAGFQAAAALGSLVSFGPQKWFDSRLLEIWPAVLSGQIAAFGLLWTSIKLTFGKRHA